MGACTRVKRYFLNGIISFPTKALKTVGERMLDDQRLNLG